MDAQESKKAFEEGYRRMCEILEEYKNEPGYMPLIAAQLEPMLQEIAELKKIINSSDEHPPSDSDT